MSHTIYSAALVGLDCKKVEIESDSSRGSIAFHIVGLADKSIEEARERVRSAIKNSGLHFPRNRATINLAPADLKKYGSLYDFPIAASLLLSSNQIPSHKLFSESLLVGELSLNGSLRAVGGILPIAISVKKMGLKNFFLPYENAAEAGIIKNINVFAVKNLTEFINHLTGKSPIHPNKHTPSENPPEQKTLIDFCDIKGQMQAKRALIIAASGAHNILLSGPPGTGKTMLAKSLQSILPPLSQEESLQVTKIYSVSGLLNKNNYLIKQRPFRSPHHTSSGASIIGGGRIPHPGEVSLAHRGILFLDEFPEFSKQVLENLRQPMEDGVITVARISRTVQFPSQFMLVAAMNPCPCGYFSDPHKECTCTNDQISRYQKKISGPIMDRIDLHVQVPKIAYKELFGKSKSQNSKEIQKIIQKNKQIQEERFKNDQIFSNSEMNHRHLNKYCALDDQSKQIFKQAVTKLNLSPRASHKILKISRTIADLGNSPLIKSHHIAEAIQFRLSHEF